MLAEELEVNDEDDADGEDLLCFLFLFGDFFTLLDSLDFTTTPAVNGVICGKLGCALEEELEEVEVELELAEMAVDGAKVARLGEVSF